MQIEVPFYFWIIFGMFIGLFLGSKKFRYEVGLIMDKISGKKSNRKKPEDEKDPTRKIEDEDGHVHVTRGGHGRGVHIREIHFDDD